MATPSDRMYTHIYMLNTYGHCTLQAQQPSTNSTGVKNLHKVYIGS